MWVTLFPGSMFVGGVWECVWFVFCWDFIFSSFYVYTYIPHFQLLWPVDEYLTQQRRYVHICTCTCTCTCVYFGTMHVHCMCTLYTHIVSTRTCNCMMIYVLWVHVTACFYDIVNHKQSLSCTYVQCGCTYCRNQKNVTNTVWPFRSPFPFRFAHHSVLPFYSFTSIFLRAMDRSWPCSML